MDKAVKKRISISVLIISTAVLLGVIYCVFVSFFGKGLPCIFNVVTGFKCVGCGNSRAALALLHLDLKSAFEYNLMFPVEFSYLAFAGISALINYIKNGKFSYNPKHKAFDISVLVILCIWLVARNIIDM